MGKGDKTRKMRQRANQVRKNARKARQIAEKKAAKKGR